MARLLVAPAELSEGPLRVGGQDHHYLSRVLRLGVGDELTLFDGAGREARARVTGSSRHELLLEVYAPRPVAAPVRPRLTLVCGLLKGDKMELVVQKATELGVDCIQPVHSARAVVPLAQASEPGRQRRWLRVAAEAARQCGRADVPALAQPLALVDALAQAPKQALRLLFWEEARQAPLGERLTGRPGEVVVAVGPEGGFSRVEAEAAQAAGFAVCGLGPRTLRAETAALAALAVVGYVLGDLGEAAQPGDLGPT
jgi:16S rRNA (uracil1498-N3)-methyltransferase